MQFPKLFRKHGFDGHRVIACLVAKIVRWSSSIAQIPKNNTGITINDPLLVILLSASALFNLNQLILITGTGNKINPTK